MLTNIIKTPDTTAHIRHNNRTRHAKHNKRQSHLKRQVRPHPRDRDSNLKRHPQPYNGLPEKRILPLSVTSMHQKIIEKIRHIQKDTRKIKDTELKHHMGSELYSLQFMVQNSIKREFSYFRHITLTIAGATGVILFWRGIYELSSQNAFLKDPHLSLVTGLIILAITGLLSKEFITVPAKATYSQTTQPSLEIPSSYQKQ